MGRAMDFVGTGKRLAPGDIDAAARDLRVEAAVLSAFLEVETAGRGFDVQDRPKMLFEPHVFWRELGPTAKRDRAAEQGLAYRKWRTGSYPRDSYPRLLAAMRIDKNAALRSASYGLGQIMGFNCQAAGHNTAEDLVQAAKLGEREQLTQLVALLRSWGLDALLRGRDFTDPASWADVARRYNGSGYAVHGYHERMAAAYAKYADDALVDEPDVPLPASVIGSGMRGEAVRSFKADLTALGYLHGAVDGFFGRKTEAAVRRFQADHGLVVDGLVGPRTRAALVDALATQPAENTEELPEWSGQRGSVAVFFDAVLALIGAVVRQLK